MVPFTTNDTLPYMRQAAGIIAEEAGANSHSAIVGLTLGKPVIIGATHATRTLKDGMKFRWTVPAVLYRQCLNKEQKHGTHCKLLC